MHIGLCTLGYHNLTTIIYSVVQARYATSFVVKYLDTATIKENSKCHKNTLNNDMIFTKEDSSTRNKHVEVLYREYKIQYRACVGSLIYLFSTRVYLCFVVDNL